jgi:hypothetical protein
MPLHARYRRVPNLSHSAAVLEGFCRAKHR